MRQILAQSSWSGGGNANRHLHKDGKMDLSAIDAPSNRGETDSSFEVPIANSNFRDRNMHPKTVPTIPFSRSSNGSMQFVPADHQTDNRFGATNETSWSALENGVGTYSNQRESMVENVVTPSSPDRRATSKHKTFSNKLRQQQSSEGMTSDFAVSSSVDGATRSSEGVSKIGRLVSMFSSRATPVVVPIQASKPEGKQDVPSSPPRSESSTGFLEWPGTQDKMGITVVAESSYEESDASAGNHDSVNGTHTISRVLEDDGNMEIHGSFPPQTSSSRAGHEPQMEDPPVSFTSQNQIQLMQESDSRENTDSVSDLSASYSKTSSAYFNPGEVQAIRKGDPELYFGDFNQYRNRLAAATVMRRCISSSKTSPRQEEPLPVLTEERLAMQNRFSAPSRSFNYASAVGYRGLLDRSKDVPNLIDDTTSDCTSRVSIVRNRHLEENENKNDRLPGLPSLSPFNSKNQFENIVIDKEDESNGLLGATCRTGMGKLNLALLGGGLTTIQTTTGDFTNRKTAIDFDETLTNSDYDQYGFAKIPGFHEMVSAGTSKHDRSLTSQSLQFANERSDQQRFRLRTKEQTEQFDFMSGKKVAVISHHIDANRDFSQYYIDPDEMQSLVKKFRKISIARCQHFDYEDLEGEEDATKAFALSEMRSRIMEKDIERGLERRGGTTVVDDIVMTSYNKAALRVRDAVIVAKAWRDGATPQDIINTADLTRRDERTYWIPRLDASAKGASKYLYEEVKWLDDNDLSQYRCHSLGPRHLKGVEMFTIGDCQSILLKLSYDRCQELRTELNEATANQIKAEGFMKAEGETFDGMMTEAEMTYLASMENVKLLSHKLVLAEKSFALVRNRIEKLVTKYEALLFHFENETDSVALSSVFSYESSCYSEDYSFAAAKHREDETLARRAQRAELRAELAARESLLSSQGMTASRREKENEVNNLKARLADLQSETSTAYTDRNRSVALARAITRSNQDSKVANSVENREAGCRNYNRLKIDDIKKRFRNRSAAKLQCNSKNKSDRLHPNESSSFNRVTQDVNNNNVRIFHRSVGEEMFQHLDFYERSLQAVGGH